MQIKQIEKLNSENQNKKEEKHNNNINNSEKPKDLFIAQNKIIFKKYKPIKQIGRGTFSTVYLASVVDSNNYVAIKAEKRNPNSVELLKSEALVLYSLKGFGIPQVLSYGRTKYHNILVMPLLGKSLLDMFIIRSSPININDICVSSLQILDRIEWVHENNIVYRDIKPENFLFGKSDNSVLYLIDFGLCRKYRSSKTGKHIAPKNLGKFTGTSRYASIYAMAGNEQSRRDDIESIGYMIIYFMKKKLPWQGIKGNSYKECYHKLYLMKKHMNLELLCRGLPGEILEYMKYAKSLKFEQEPNYNYLKNLFKIILNNNKINIDKYILSWCKNDKSDNTNKENIELNSNNLIDNKIKNKINSPRNTTPSDQFCKKVKENLEKKIIIPKRNNLNINNSIKNIIYTNRNSLLNKNEINSDISNTLKVLVNKNLQSLNNSGQNQSAGINLNLVRINSEKNVYSDNFLIQRMNSNLKGYISPNNNIGQLISFNQQLTDKNNYNSGEKLPNYSNYFNTNINKTNQVNKIIGISPIPHNNMHKNNNNLFLKINNNSKNKHNKITHIKITNVSNDNNHNNSNIYNNNKENIIYNTYNTFNTFNSYNNINTINPPMNNNISFINSLYKREPSQIRNYQSYNLTKKDKIQNNNLSNYFKSESFYENNRNKSNKLNKIFPQNKIFIIDKYSSIDTTKKNDSITGYFSYKNIQNQRDLNSYNINNIKKSNTTLINNKIISKTPILNLNQKSDKTNNNINNKIHHNNSYIIKNKIDNDYVNNNYLNTNNINHGKNNFLKVTKHSNKKNNQNLNSKKINNNYIDNSSYKINNSKSFNISNNKSIQVNQNSNKTLENHSYYINNNMYGYGLNKNSSSPYIINKNKIDLKGMQTQRNIMKIDNKKSNNKIIENNKNSLPHNHSLKIIKTSSKKNIKNYNDNNKLNEENLNTNKINRINKYKIVRNKNVHNH